jgi:hypothetical protein
MTEIKTRRLLSEMDHADHEIRGWLETRHPAIGRKYKRRRLGCQAARSMCGLRAGCCNRNSISAGKRGSFLLATPDGGNGQNLSALPDPDYFPPETTDNEPDDKVNDAGQCT